MNVAAGILIGVTSESWRACLLLPFVWGFVHCAYELILGRHNNLVVLTTREGHPIASYYISGYLTALVTSLPFSVISFLVAKCLS